MKHTDFQDVFDLIESLEGSERGRIETGLILELELLRRGELDQEDLPTHENWREWLEGPQEMRWSKIEKRYIAASPYQADYLRAELRFFLVNHAEYLVECENCGRFFVKTNKRPQRFCKGRGSRVCRDEYHTGKRKTPEGRKERAIYMRELRSTKRRLKREKEKKRKREEQKRLDQIPKDIDFT